MGNQMDWGMEGGKKVWTVHEVFFFQGSRLTALTLGSHLCDKFPTLQAVSKD